MIVAFLNQQDGVGKTTLALHLAGVWASQGHRVAVIDADPDACAVEWSELRAQGNAPVLNRCNARPSVMRDLTQALANYDPPALTSLITERAVFANAMESGRLACETPYSVAAVHEITALAAEVERIVP